MLIFCCVNNFHKIYIFEVIALGFIFFAQIKWPDKSTTSYTVLVFESDKRKFVREKSGLTLNIANYVFDLHV